VNSNIADLHIHSRYSRAASGKLEPCHLNYWARIKGLSVVGTGDCTHPRWLSDLRKSFDDAESGLYMLKPALRVQFEAAAAQREFSTPIPTGAADPRFVLTGEVCTIYKKGDKTRKVHHIVLLPDFKAAQAFQRAIGKKGNITADGRPVLNIESEELLKILLESAPGALLIPAHIWTPWFSALGASSGFESIEECYGEGASQIPAVETGLSSNPPMNWAIPALDKFAIVSNSDSHSPEKLGREATILDMEMSFAGLSDALWRRNGADVKGTIEFFPQEGKYHYDGHRKCEVSLTPEEAVECSGICPVCGRPLTRGVLGRVRELAGQEVREAGSPDGNPLSNQRPYYSLIPLGELLGGLLNRGEASKKTRAIYNELITAFGSELHILMDTKLGDLARFKNPFLSGEDLSCAIGNMRAGRVTIECGYDGEYGVIRAVR